MPLYLWDAKLLVAATKLACGQNCCCDDDDNMMPGPTGPCAPCLSCVTVCITHGDYQLLTTLHGSVSECHAAHYIENATLLDSQGNNSPEKISAYILVATDALYVSCSLSDENTGNNYVSPITQRKADTLLAQGCDTWGTHVDVYVDLFETSDCDDVTTSPNNVRFSIFFGAPCLPEAYTGVRKTYVITNTMDIDASDCPINDPFNNQPWDGVLDGGGPWTQLAAPHYQHNIDVSLTSESDSVTGECYYLLEIKCSDNIVLLSAKKKTCGGPAGDYGGLSIIEG